MGPVHLAVVGAHLSGQPLNIELTARGATLVATTTTAPCYRLVALATLPPKPGLIRTTLGDERGGAIEVEVYELDVTAFGEVVASVPAPLCIGRVVLADGSDVAGFLCETVGATTAPDITAFGGWRAYLAAAAGPG
jgi:allophanate hydrolase